jgi:hypothetical protein
VVSIPVGTMVVPFMVGDGTGAPAMGGPTVLFDNTGGVANGAVAVTGAKVPLIGPEGVIVTLRLDIDGALVVALPRADGVTVVPLTIAEGEMVVSFPIVAADGANVVSLPPAMTGAAMGAKDSASPAGLRVVPVVGNVVWMGVCTGVGTGGDANAAIVALGTVVELGAGSCTGTVSDGGSANGVVTGAVPLDETGAAAGANGAVTLLLLGTRGPGGRTRVGAVTLGFWPIVVGAAPMGGKTMVGDAKGAPASDGAVALLVGTVTVVGGGRDGERPVGDGRGNVGGRPTAVGPVTLDGDGGMAVSSDGGNAALGAMVKVRSGGGSSCRSKMSS